MSNFKFLDPGKLIDDELELKLIKTSPANEERGYVPVYDFEMSNCETGDKMGSINLRIGYNENIHFGGNIGYEVDEKFRGHHYAARSCKLLFSFAKKHGMDTLWATCNPENAASRRTLERVGGELIETVDLPEDNDQYHRGERKKCIYKFNI